MDQNTATRATLEWWKYRGREDAEADDRPSLFCRDSGRIRLTKVKQNQDKLCWSEDDVSSLGRAYLDGWDAAGYASYLKSNVEFFANRENNS